MLLDYGLEGYGLYWYCIELIAGKVEADNITFSLEHDARIIARNTGSTVQKVEEMMRYFIKIGLFENSDGVITCMKLAKRLDQSMTSNKEMRAIIGGLKGKTEGVIAESDQSENENHDSVKQIADAVMQEENRLEENRTNKVSQKLDFDSWPAIPNQCLLDEWKAMRKRMKAPVSQTVINRTGKELHKAVSAGFTVDQCFEQWIYKGWRGFEADWMNRGKAGQGAQQSTQKPKAFST